MAKAKKRGGYTLNAQGKPQNAQGNPVEPFEAETGENDSDDGPLSGLSFTTTDTKNKAVEAGLTAADFEGVEAGGKTGYTSAQLDALIEEKDEDS